MTTRPNARSRISFDARFGVGLAGVLCVGLACSVEDGILGGLRGTTSGGAGWDSANAGAPSEGQSESSECALTSPNVKLPGSDSQPPYATCTGRIAAATFNNALCVCNDVELGDYLKTRGFDSSQGEYVVGQTEDGGAAVGINGTYKTLAGYTDVGGSLSIGGPTDVRFIGYLTTRGDFRSAGNVTVAGAAAIARNAWLSGSYVGLGPFEVKGELHHAKAVVAVPTSAASDYLESVSVSAPCPCNLGETVRIDQLVEQAATTNDNVAHSIQPDVLASVQGSAELVLPCGRFYLSEIAGSGIVVIRAKGMTALFVEGSIALAGELQIDVAPGAELDVFVRGNVSTLAPMTLSTEQRPAATRLFVAGSDDINLYSPFIGNLYAPNGRVMALGALTVYGSIFARAFLGATYASFIYDRAVYEAGRNCMAEPMPTCSVCGTCTGGTACVEGTCGPCRADADCCGQSVCANGACAPLMGLLQ